MRNLEEYLGICINICIELEIPIGTISSISVNNRYTRRWGCCTKVADGVYTIQINPSLVNESISKKDDGLANTILHELLHTCPGCLNHGDLWKSYAEKIHNTFGYDIKRTSTSEEKGVEESPTQYKYICKCIKCGKIVRYCKRNSADIVKRPNRYRHTGCGGNISVSTNYGEELLYAY